MSRHCKTCSCKNVKEKCVEYPCEYCGKLCMRKTARALCSLKCRLLGNIKKQGDCMIWQGKIGMDGYGLIMIDGLRKRVHRVCFELFHGSIPEGHLICHSCDVTQCINPQHLFTGTHIDNMRDMAEKGRANNQFLSGYKRMTRIKIKKEESKE